MASEQGDAPFELRQRVEETVGQQAVAWERPDTGMSLAHRFVVTFEGGMRVFVKAATTEKTAAQLRNERLALMHAPGLAPAEIAWIDEISGFPALLTEALNGHWPASHKGIDWRPGDIGAVLASLSRLQAIAPPEGLAPPPAFSVTDWPGVGARVVGTALESVASAGWFERNAAVLASAEGALDRSGTVFVHGDVRSDNICLMPHGPRFVDWSSAHAGSPDADLALFLPATHLEGGPAPFEVFPGGGRWAVAQAGATLSFALDESGPHWLRRIARWLTAIDLDWAVASLGLEPRDGKKRSERENDRKQARTPVL